jgi:hypothetical protein
MWSKTGKFLLSLTNRKLSLRNPEFNFYSYFYLRRSSIETDMREATIIDSLNFKDSGSISTDFVKS